jgi:hypothetical protein
MSNGRAAAAFRPAFLGECWRFLAMIMYGSPAAGGN